MKHYPFPLITLAALLVLIQCSLPSPAGAAIAPATPPGAATLAEHISAHSDELIHAAELPGPSLDAEHKFARDRFIALQRAAAAFREHPDGGPGPVPKTLNDLREAYSDAARYFETIRHEPRSSAAIQHLNADYRALLRLYGLVETLTPADLARIENNSGLIVDYADRLAATARAEMQSGRVGADDYARIERVAAAAHGLRDALRAAGPDPYKADGAFTDLMDRLLEARAVLARFTMNTQGDYGLLWNVTQTLSDLAPQASIAGFPYESRSSNGAKSKRLGIKQ